jgi:hypothetical protein
MRWCNPGINARNVIRDISNHAASLIRIDEATVGAAASTTIDAV